MKGKMILASGLCLFLSLALFPWSGKGSEKAVDKFSINGTGQYLSVEQFRTDLGMGSTIEGKGVNPGGPIARIGTEAEALPVSYTDRRFIKGSSALTYDIDLLPGNIVKYDPKKDNYEIMNLTRFVKNGENPKNKLIEDGILYDQKINSGASFNGSGLIANLSITKDQLAEILIQDIMRSIVPDELILTDSIRAKVQKIPAAELGKYYFVRSSVLTIINYRVFKKTSFSVGISCSYVTADHKVYSSTDKMRRERMISVDLIPLKDLL
jgi:hypothetical protein